LDNIEKEILKILLEDADKESMFSSISSAKERRKKNEKTIKNIPYKEV